jgi:alpha-L-fucosidase
VVAIYKWHDVPPGAAVLDLELGRFDTLTYHDWITDTTVDAGRGWAYLEGAEYKTLARLVHTLVDNVSKNGSLLLNVGPKPNGEIPEPARDLLLGMGKWLEVNGEAIYGTTPWLAYGEGPTQMAKAGYFIEHQDVQYTAQDIRFTTRDAALYAICLGVPREPFTIQSFRHLYPGEIRSVSLLGCKAPVRWSLARDGLTIDPPANPPCEHACAYRIERGDPFGGGRE